jgi:hypothetical protein
MGMRKIKLKLRVILNSSKPPKSCVSASAQLRKNEGQIPS